MVELDEFGEGVLVEGLGVVLLELLLVQRGEVDLEVEPEVGLLQVKLLELALDYLVGEDLPQLQSPDFVRPRRQGQQAHDFLVDPQVVPVATKNSFI